MKLQSAMSRGMDKILPLRDEERRLSETEQVLAFETPLLWPFVKFADRDKAKQYVDDRLRLQRKYATAREGVKREDFVDYIDAKRDLVNDDAAVNRGTRINRLAGRIESVSLATASVVVVGSLLLGVNAVHDVLNNEEVAPENSGYENSCDFTPSTTAASGPQFDVLRNQHFASDLQCPTPSGENDGVKIIPR